MKKVENQRGSTLVLALLILLIFLGLTVAMLMDARSQAAINSGVKLTEMYNTAAISLLNRYRSNNLPNVWVTPDAYGSADSSEYRFGGLLKDGDPFGATPEASADGYGILVERSTLTMNAGMLPLNFDLWAKNNPDDPAFTLAGLQPVPSSKPPVEETWDFDGRLILTVEIFLPGDLDNPVAVRTLLVGPAGAEIVDRYGDSQQETGSNTQNTGYNSSGVVDLSDYQPPTP